MASEALKHENKIKKENFLFFVNTINTFISCNENIQIFHSCFGLVKTQMFLLHSVKIFMVFTSKE